MQSALGLTLDSFDQGLAAFLAEQLAGVAANAVPSAVIAGTVRDGAGDPLSGTTVYLTDAVSREQRRTTADESGRFVFRDLPGGRYRLGSSTTGVRRVEVAIPNGAAVERDLVVPFGPFRERTVIALPAFAAPPAPRALPAGWRCAADDAAACGPESLVQELESELAERRQASTTGPRALFQDTRFQYPDLLRISGREGAVTLDGVIGTDGRLHDVRTAFASNPDVERAALAAVRNWRWEPARLRGVPAEVPVTLSLEFTGSPVVRSRTR
jgi:protein TonB